MRQVQLHLSFDVRHVNLRYDSITYLKAKHLHGLSIAPRSTQPLLSLPLVDQVLGWEGGLCVLDAVDEAVEDPLELEEVGVDVEGELPLVVD